MTEAAFRNALCLDMALGCSTNTVLHLPAIAHEAGIEFDLDWVNEADVYKRQTWKGFCCARRVLRAKRW